MTFEDKKLIEFAYIERDLFNTRIPKFLDYTKLREQNATDNNTSILDSLLKRPISIQMTKDEKMITFNDFEKLQNIDINNITYLYSFGLSMYIGTFLNKTSDNLITFSFNNKNYSFHYIDNSLSNIDTGNLFTVIGFWYTPISGNSTFFFYPISITYSTQLEYNLINKDSYFRDKLTNITSDDIRFYYPQYKTFFNKNGLYTNIHNKAIGISNKPHTNTNETLKDLFQNRQLQEIKDYTIKLIHSLNDNKEKRYFDDDFSDYSII